MNMKPCPECGGTLKRMYSKEYLDEHFPVNSPMDRANIKLQIESKRLFECSNCGFKYRLNDKEYAKYVLSQLKRDK